MEKLAASKNSTVTTYGLYLGLGSIFFSLITVYGGFFGNKWFGYLGYVIYIGVIVLGLNNYKDKLNNGILTYGQGLGLGVLISLVGGIITAIYTYIFFAFIEPSKINELLALAQEEMLKSGTSEAHIEKASEMMSMFFNPAFMAISQVIGAVIGGLIISLIVAAIVKKDPQPEF